MKTNYFAFTRDQIDYALGSIMAENKRFDFKTWFPIGNKESYEYILERNPLTGDETVSSAYEFHKI